MEEMKLRLMTAGDIPAGMRLREQAGWNQTEQDWQHFLALEPEGCFVVAANGAVCGTVTTLSFEKQFGWVSMVLVDAAYRRRGVGTRLLQAGIDYLESKGVQTVKLDATPAGRVLYLQRGFQDEYEIERWEFDSHKRSNKESSPVESGNRLRQRWSEQSTETETIISRRHWKEICRLDQEIFGADRSALLERIWNQAPELASVLLANGSVRAYAFARRGARALQFGPWVAGDADSARILLERILERTVGSKIFVDVSLKHAHARFLIQAAGFAFQRPLTRMYRGPNNYPGIPERVCSIAGPELG